VHRIKNPAYKGIWVAPDIDNPDFKDDPKLHVQKDIKYIGFELWQVRFDGEGVHTVCRQ
jgi:calreticulin